MSELVIFILGMVVMLLIALLIVGMIVVVKLSKKVRNIDANLISVIDHGLPELQRKIEDSNDDLYKTIEESKDDLYKTIEDSERETEKKIDSRVDKLKLHFEQKFNIHNI